MATVVGVFVRQAGVWERANGGTPTGFSGPQVRQAGVWNNCVVVESYIGGWQVSWVNIDGEISIEDNSKSASDPVGPPWSASVTFNFNGDDVGGEDWRDYDCGRDYEIKFTEDLSGSWDPWTTHPTLATWLDFTDPDTDYSFSREVSFQASFQSKMEVRIREKVSAPSAGNDVGEFTGFVEAGDI